MAVHQDSRLKDLLGGQKNLLLIEDFISIDELKNIRTQILGSFGNNEFNLQLPDGIFAPFPYSSVHKNIQNSLNNYFSFSNEFKKRHQSIIELIINRIQEKLKDEIKPLIYKDEKIMSPLNSRILYTQKNGIDIHCENAFIHQLEDEFSKWLISKVDLMNSISFFLVLQKSEKGGNLILFNQCWNDISFRLDSTTYNERHDINGSIFKNRNVSDVSYSAISPNEGEAVFFRAAQIWHAIDKIEGKSDRISIGCFIAKGHDGNNYYWA